MTAPSERVPAIGYIRTDLCEASRRLDGQRLHRLSLRLGYALQETILTDTTVPDRLVLLEDRIRIHRAEAVFVPTADHLDGQLARIVVQADVIERDGQTHARWSPCANLLDETVIARLTQRWIDEQHRLRNQVQ